MPDEERLRELVAEATVDCYDEEEAFWGMWATLEDELNYPLSASLIGEVVELIGLDGNASSSHRGIVARVRTKGQTYSVSLADLQITDPDSHSAEWLAAYQYWLRY
ncbi:MAG: calcium-binding protein [Anaerolineae bacterium]